MASFKISFRTKNLLRDAEKLQKEKFYQSSILLYSHYLEHVILTTAVMEYRENPIKAQKFLEKILKKKDEGRLNFNNILKLVPNSIFTKETMANCETIRIIRNTVGAHHYFAIGLGYQFLRIEEVNYYKKIIRRIYKLMNDDLRLDKVEYFLNQVHPLIAHRMLEDIIIEVEDEIMSRLCKKVSKLVKETATKIYNSGGPLGKFY